MLKDISLGTCAHLLSQIDDEALDIFWREVSKGRHPIIDLQGNLSYSLLSEEGLLFIRNDFGTSYDLYELVFGSLFLPDTVQELLFRDKVLLLIVYREGTDNLLISRLDVDTKFMLDLPQGQYFFFAFVLDEEAETLLDSRIYAIGLPSKNNSNNPELESFYLNHPVDILEFVEPTPVDVKFEGPFYINLIMIDVEKIPECSLIFSEIFSEIMQ